MKRFLTVALVSGLALGAVNAFAQATHSDITFTTNVGTIVKWITDRSDASTDLSSDSWTTWNYTGTGGTGSGASVLSSAMTDTFTTLRLVANANVTLTASGGAGSLIMTHPTTTTETLATFWNICTDGDGTTAITSTTGSASSGFLAAALTTTAGTGGTATLGGAAQTGLTPTFRNYVYVGGGAVTKEAGGVGTATRSTLPTDANYSVQLSSGNTPTTGTLLGASGTVVTHIARDGAVLIRVQCRALNPDDFGLDSDYSEAPEPGAYTATIALTATP
jgi:hypothetical protein